MYFGTYRLRTTFLDKSLKSPVSEIPWASNMVNSTKHFWNLNDRMITIFIDPCETNSGWEVSLSNIQVLGLFFTPFTADNKYSLLNRDNL